MSGYSGGRSLIRRDDIFGPGGVAESGGCCPPWDGVGTPDPNELVLFEFVAAGDGVTTARTTAFPYTSGSLRVYFNSRNVTYDKVEDDNTTGDFSTGTPADDSPLQNVYVTYNAL